MNHENYCSYELSKKLKEKGFDWECDFYYYNGKGPSRIPINIPSPFSMDYQNICLAPTLSQAQKWLREEKGIEVYVIPSKNKTYEVYLDYVEANLDYSAEILSVEEFYEQGLMTGITEALERI